ncbi:MAG: tetratricopeptide (TPR) repeat protein [Crocinitomix sp.]|jgi:tetratricopeptide (TPR) repeat protein
MVIKKSIIVLLLCQLTYTGLAQINKQDSLKIRDLDKEARSYISRDKEKAIEICDEAINLANSDREMMLIPMTTKALTYFQHGEKEASVALMNNVILIAKAINNDKSLSSAYRNLGQIEEYTGSFDKAIENYMLANEAYQRSSEYEGNPNLYMTIADLHFRLEDISKAKENYRNGLSLAPIWQNDKLIAEFEVKLAKIFLVEDEIDSAFYYANKAELFYNSSDQKPTVNDPKEVLAEIAIKQGNLGVGIKYYENLLDSLVLKEDTRRIAYVAQKLGTVLLKKEDYVGALEAFDLSLKSNEKLQSPAIIDDYEMLAFINEKKGNLKEAYRFQKKYSDKYEEILNAEKLKQINDLQVKYDTEKKERENEKLNFDLSLKEKENKIVKSGLTVRNYIIVGVITLFLILLGLAFLAYNRRKVVQDNKMLKLEQKLLKTQMNPHFISNALMSAQGYIYDNKPKEASSYLTQIARLTRLVLENSRKESISLEDEISTLESYLLVQQKRYENFDFELTVGDDLDPEEIHLPPMLTQPFVENAIEHGVQNLSYRGLLQINFSSIEKNKLQISIADNGLGINNSSKSTEDHQSLSSQIVKERLKNLAEFYKQKLDFNITNNSTSQEQGEGTKVILTLPLSN